MTHKKQQKNTVRAKAWGSMRILRLFTLHTVLVTVPGADSESDYENIKKWFKQLERHGYIAKNGKPRTWQGEQQVWRLVDDTGPAHPVCCRRCQQSLTTRECALKEKEKETEKEKGEQP